MKITSGFILLLMTVRTFGQGFPDFQAVSIASIAEIKKKDVQILESANYILSHPVDSLNPERDNAMGTVLLWMMSTPDYTFFIDETIVPIMKKDAEILAIYMVSMTQFVLENPHFANDPDEVKLQAFTRLLNYCDHPENNIKKSKAIEQAITALRTGWLKEYLKIS
jgi:hypothetical protein